MTPPDVPSDDDLFAGKPAQPAFDEVDWSRRVRESIDSGHMNLERDLPTQAEVLRNWARFTVVLPELDREVAIAKQRVVMLDENAGEMLRAALAEAEAERHSNGNGKEHAGGPFIDWTTFWDHDHHEAEWVYQDVLARGRGHALYATHKAGKSLLMLFVAAALATGKEPVVVAYLDYEMTEADLVDRLEDMGYGAGTDFSRLRYALLPTLPPLDTIEGAEALEQLLDGVQAEFPDHHLVTIIDTISRAVKGEENEADTFRAFYNCTGIRLKRRGATWCRLDHAGKDATKGQRGTSGKGDDVDLVWKLVRTENGIRLDRELSRMGWVPEKVTFLELSDPLHYARANDDWPPGTRELAELLDRLHVPLDATPTQARQVLTDNKTPKRKQLILAAKRYRYERSQGGDA